MAGELWSVYDGMAAAFEKHSGDGAYNAHYERPAMLALVGDVAGAHVLDAACGPGFYAEELVRRGATVEAFDASPAMVDRARARLGPAVPVERAVLGDPLPYADGRFDLVVCALAIHYAEDRAAAFRELARVTRPRGAILVSTQHPTQDWMRKGGSYFDSALEEDEWERDGEMHRVRFWREPLGALCTAVAGAGLLIERLVEPLPADSMRDRWPDDWEKLIREPGFLILRLLRP